MDVGKKVKYYFPKPVKHEKEYVTGIITHIVGNKIVLLCEDNTQLVLPLQDIARLHVIKEESESIFKGSYFNVSKYL